MTLADKITFVRLVLAPIFFVIYLLPRFFPSGYGEGLFISLVWTVPVLWVLFLVSEISDLLDGIVARKRGEVSDFGKLFDPFADTLAKIAYFLCFVIDGIFPALAFLIVLYREYSVLFVRNLMLKKGIAMGARMSGKVKTVCYFIAGALALLASSFTRLGFDGDFYRWLVMAANVVFVCSVVVAVFSLIEYVLVYKKTPVSENK